MTRMDNFTEEVLKAAKKIAQDGGNQNDDAILWKNADVVGRKIFDLIYEHFGEITEWPVTIPPTEDEIKKSPFIGSEDIVMVVGRRDFFYYNGKVAVIDCTGSETRINTEDYYDDDILDDMKHKQCPACQNVRIWTESGWHCQFCKEKTLFDIDCPGLSDKEAIK